MMNKASSVAGLEETKYNNMVYNDDGSDYNDDVNRELLASAEQNACDTGNEQGFEEFSERWYRVVMDSYFELLNACQ